MLTKLLILASVMLLPWHALAAGVPAPPAKPVVFETHDGYFVSNKFEPQEPVSFVVLRDQESFGKVFGVAMVMGDKSHRLALNAFDKKLVVAAIHRGKAMVTYQVASMMAEAETLIVRYTTKSEPSDTAEFACPLILSLDKGNFNTVRFVENGRDIKHMTLAPTHAAATRSNKPEALTEKSADGKTVFSIRGGGIGHTTLACDPDLKPQEILLRAYLRGLESLTLANDRVQWKASVLSHSGHPTLLHLWQNGKEGPALSKESSYWAEIRRLGPDGKPAAGLPPEGGWFEMTIPQALLTDTRELKLSWIDFYR
ncbi:MAG: hypothetical protein NTW21_31445 [Verrucomicrobia bacterium]|nr:hypothetical protein [Verrucomicrobiota bacterium]